MLLAAYGFLGSEEIKAAGATNLGLRDREFRCISLVLSTAIATLSERLALRWVNKYIGNFGGDPNCVVL